MYRCAKTVPAPPFAERGGCNPDYDELMEHGRHGADAAVLARDRVGRRACRTRMTAGHAHGRDADQGVPRAHRADERGGPGDPGRPLRQRRRDQRGEGARPRAGEQGPARAAARHPGAASTTRSTSRACRRPAARSRCRSPCPSDDSAIVAKLKAAGAIILGKTNVSELERPVRREHARGVLVARRPGAAAVGHRQDARPARPAARRRRRRPAWRR